MDFLFHKVSEKEKEDIKKQAKKILDDFSKQLSKVERAVSEPMIEREKGEREEAGIRCDEIDKKIMFENAPEKKGDFIVAERKKW